MGRMLVYITFKLYTVLETLQKLHVAQTLNQGNKILTFCYK